jgi:hypothetical protein
MRDVVAETGLLFEELGEVEALELGCLTALQRRQRRGYLSRQEYLCQAAARGGHLEELKLLRENGGPWDERTCQYAAKGGYLDLLQWAHANDCPWDTITCKFAAQGGHLEVLQWLRANGCPWDWETCEVAAEGEKHFDVAAWVRENN